MSIDFFEKQIADKFRCLYCQELCKWNKTYSSLECTKHSTTIEYGFKGKYDSQGNTISDSYKLEFFAFRSKLSCNNFRAAFIMPSKKFLLQQQVGNEMVMKKVLEFDFLPELFPDTVSDKIKNYLVFS